MSVPLFRILILMPGLLLACDQAGGGSPACNVLVLVTDDQGLALGAYGNSGLTTPSLDELAAEGLVFTRAYTCTAICLPSRATLYTGRVPARSGCTGFEAISRDVPLWPKLLGDAGYRTGLVGKLAGKPKKRFTFDFLSRTYPKDDGAREPQYYLEEVERFLQLDDGRPFCLLVNLRDPHEPFPVDGAPTGVPGVDDTPHDPSRVQVPAFLPDLPEVRQEVARFLDAVRRVDAAVGLILKALDAAGARDSTLVLFSSDHGMPFPFAKGTLYEAGIRVPLVARWPGEIEPGRTGAMVGMHDILPTLLELGGEQVREDMDGRSLLDLLRGKRSEHREVFFATHTSHKVPPDLPSRAVIHDGWKYIRNFGEGTFDNRVLQTSLAWPAIQLRGREDQVLEDRVRRLLLRPTHELYHIDEDPWERLDRSEEPAQAVRLQGLQALLLEEMQRTEDPMLVSW